MIALVDFSFLPWKALASTGKGRIMEERERERKRKEKQGNVSK